MQKFVRVCLLVTFSLPCVPTQTWDLKLLWRGGRVKRLSLPHHGAPAGKNLRGSFKQPEAPQRRTLGSCLVVTPSCTLIRPSAWQSHVPASHLIVTHAHVHAGELLLNLLERLYLCLNNRKSQQMSQQLARPPQSLSQYNKVLIGASPRFSDKNSKTRWADCYSSPVTADSASLFTAHSNLVMPGVISSV